ncbi:MAG: flavodoxin domain-containing protein [Chitinophagaceae bacterium]|nr:flavodoxin domain-containing protein [Chitinophagaceae bacterium]
MSYLVVYMSHHGTTQKIACHIAEELGSGVTLVNLGENDVPDLTSFSTIIVGGSIHMGLLQKKIIGFCEQNMETLLGKRLGLFLCFMNKAEGQKEFDKVYPSALREHALAKGLFGGELLLEKMNFVERMVVRTVKAVKKSVSEIEEDEVAAFIDTIKEK